MIERPLDLLNESKGKQVLIYCKEGEIFSGELLAFDIHINVALDDMQELDREGNVRKKLGLSFIRGDTIKYISPGKK